MDSIRIVNLLNSKTVNFGNRLQAYAIETIIRSIFPTKDVKTIIISNKPVKIGSSSNISLFKSYFHKFIGVINDIIFAVEGGKRRLHNQVQFSAENMIIESGVFDLKRLSSLSVDYIVVGSDVVWQQTENLIFPERLLAFNKNNAKPIKVSYAASLGRDYIPNSNKDIFISSILDFDYISVREQSSVSFLNSLVNTRVQHVVDPTLLMSVDLWREKEKSCDIVDKYVFVYLLGSTKEQRDAVRRFADNNGMKIATVPCANGVVYHTDSKFGDYRIWSCGIEQWLWLIDHAQYVITDSFHGCVFSTIFHKRFVALSRDYAGCENINNRIIDYLSMINQNDKCIGFKDIENVSDLKWDYSDIDIVLKSKIDSSLKFLINSLS